MRRIGSVLGHAPLQVAIGVLFLVLVTWPLMAIRTPSGSVRFVYAVWIGAIVFLALVAGLGRERTDDDGAEDEFEEDEGV